MRTDTIIIGGGAAGCFAAVQAARLGKSVLVFDKNEKLGRKLRITGKGRCNVTNACPSDELMKNEQTILTAKTREELFAKFDELKASIKDVNLSTGAVGRNDDGTLILQVNIVKL